MRPPPTIPLPDLSVIVARIEALPVAGVTFTPKRPLACGMCRRRIGVQGRIPGAGYVTCDDTACALTTFTALSTCFPGPYGLALTRASAAGFTRIVDLPDGRVLLQRAPLIRQAKALSTGYRMLLHWQRAFDRWERETDSEGYAKGKVHVLPPRRIGDVAAIRTTGELVPVDPTLKLSEEAARTLRLLYEEIGK